MDSPRSALNAGPMLCRTNRGPPETGEGTQPVTLNRCAATQQTGKDVTRSPKPAIQKVGPQVPL